MTTVEVEVISKDIIKPSSPTPNHLRCYGLSFLDQIQVPVFMPFVLFFPRDASDALSKEQCSRIKWSLSDALAQYYPLAGRVRDNLYVDCNDEGVPYVEAQVKCELSSILDNPIPQVMSQFLPYELDDVRDLAAAVQVNLFKCGGLGLGLVISHKVADALSFFVFLNTWAAIARGDSGIPSPSFDTFSLFPPADLSGFSSSFSIVKNNISTKRFVFDSIAIAALRERFSNHSPIATSNTSDYHYHRSHSPTRTEALSSFLWNRFMASTQSDTRVGDKPYSVVHAVNLRPRMDPPLTKHHFGNICSIAITMPILDSGNNYEIINKFRDAIKQVDCKHVKRVREAGESHVSSLKDRARTISQSQVMSFSFSSLCGFPIYEANFGWGKPAWIAYASTVFKNGIVLMDTKSGDGIEAWVNLTKEDMAKFEKDKELLALVSPSVSVNVESHTRVSARL